MRDYIQEFKKQKFRKNTMIVVASFAFAFLVNGFLFWTNVWNKLQADIKWATTEKTNKVVNSDLYLVKQWTWSDTVSLKVWTSIKKIKELRVSLAYNPDENIFKINNISNDNDKNIEIIKISNTPWINSLTIKFKNPVDIKEDYTIANIMYTKNNNENTSINLSSANFVSWNDTYELTTSSIQL